MKEVYSYQEIAHFIENDQAVTFTRHLHVQVTAAKKHHDTETIHVTLVLLVGEYTIGEVRYEYASMEALLDAFDISDVEEFFELLDDE